MASFSSSVLFILLFTLETKLVSFCFKKFLIEFRTKMLLSGLITMIVMACSGFYVKQFIKSENQGEEMEIINPDCRTKR